MKVSELYDGASILLEESSGTYSSYTLMQHNYNSGKALLWRDASIGSVKWRTSTVSYYNNLYQTSYLDSYLNGTWYSSLLSTTRGLLTPLSYPVSDYNSGGNPTSITRNAATVSATELGLVVDSNYGSTMDYAVAGIIDRDVNYWTRQPVNSSSTVYYVYSDGSRDNSSSTASYAVFPTVGISESTSVEWDGNLGGYKLSSATSSSPAAPAALYLNGGSYNYGEVEPGTSFTLSWDASTSASVTGYIVYYKDTGDTTYTSVGSVTSLYKTVYAPDSYSTTRTFYVRAVNSNNYVSDYSTATRYVTTKAAPTVSVPTPPASVYLYDGALEGNFGGVEPGASFTLTWDKSTSSSITGYMVYYIDTGDTSYTRDGYTSSLSKTVYAPNTYSTSRTFYVAAVNANGVGAMSSSYRYVVTKSEETLSAPKKLYLNGDEADWGGADINEEYTLSWDAVTSTSVIGYAVWRKTDSMSDYILYRTTTKTSISVFASSQYYTSSYFKVQTLGSNKNSDLSETYRYVTTRQPFSYYNGTYWTQPQLYYYDSNNNRTSIQDIIYYPSYRVTELDRVQYGFRRNSGGYFESENKGVDNSYALCKVRIFADGVSHMYIDCINYGESIYDYGILSRIDTTLTLSNAADSTNVQQSFSGMQSNSIQIVDYGIPAAGEHYVYIKYRKDGSAYGGNDSLQFKIRFE